MSDLSRLSVKNGIWRIPEGIVGHFSIPEIKQRKAKISGMTRRMFEGGMGEGSYFKHVRERELTRNLAKYQ